MAAQDLEAEPGNAPEEAGTEPEEEFDIEAWRPQIAKVRQQLDLLQLFSKFTMFGGIKVKIPRGIQRIPLGKLGGLGDQVEEPEEGVRRRGIDLAALERRGIEIYLKEVEFRNLAFQYDEEPKVVGDHPAIVSMLDFVRIGLKIDVKTRVGKFPVGCEFRTGKLPFDFDLVQSGYALNVLPEDRAETAQLDNVAINLGGPVSRRVLSHFFGRELARVVLEFAAGQTLKMDRGSLLGDAVTPRSILEGLIK